MDVAAKIPAAVRARDVRRDVIELRPRARNCHRCDRELLLVAHLRRSKLKIETYELETSAV